VFILQHIPKQILHEFKSSHIQAVYPQHFNCSYVSYFFRSAAESVD